MLQLLISRSHRNDDNVYNQRTEWWCTSGSCGSTSNGGHNNNNNDNNNSINSNNNNTSSNSNSINNNNTSTLEINNAPYCDIDHLVSTRFHNRCMWTLVVKIHG